MKYRRKYIKEKILIRDMYKKNLFVSIIYMSACSFSCKNIDQDNQVSKNISMMLMQMFVQMCIFLIYELMFIYIFFFAQRRLDFSDDVVLSFQ